MVKPFAQVTTRTQVNRLRALARAALPTWGLPDAKLRLLNHGYNTIFAVHTADGRRYALRVNTQPHKTEPQLRGRGGLACRAQCRNRPACADAAANPGRVS